MDKDDKIEVENINCPGQISRINAEKYLAMKDALLRALPPKAPGYVQQEMFDAIQPFLNQDLWPGGAKSAWWCKTVQLDLEAKGIILRQKQKPIRWHLI